LLPDLQSAYGVLPPGRHPADMAEVHERFVVGAPYAAERELLWTSFRAWEALVRVHLPTAILWINGGFATHKAWGAPSDVDVVLLVRDSERQAAGDGAILPLLSHPDPQGRIVKAMSGQVDAYLAIRGQPTLVTYWNGLWQQVKGEDGLEVAGMSKGYVEVRP
jgi:hypothetical protein